MAEDRERIGSGILDMLRRDRLPHPVFPVDGDPLGGLDTRELAAVVFGLWTCKPRSCRPSEDGTRCLLGSYRPNALAVTEAQARSVERALGALPRRRPLQHESNAALRACATACPLQRPTWAWGVTRTRSVSRDAGYCPHCHKPVARLRWNADDEAPCHQCGRRVVAFAGFWYRSLVEAKEGCDQQYRDWLVCRAGERDRRARAIAAGIDARIARAHYPHRLRRAAGEHDADLRLIGDGADEDPSPEEGAPTPPDGA